METSTVVKPRRRTARAAGWASMFTLSVILLLVASGGCRFVTTRIGTILAKPADYINREVTVVGNVTESVKLPLLPALYGINDGTGEIMVVTDAQPPLSGTRARVRGRVEAAVTVGSRSVGLHLREIQRY